VDRRTKLDTGCTPRGRESMVRQHPGPFRIL
jgi:hypothetical protein